MLEVFPMSSELRRVLEALSPASISCPVIKLPNDPSCEQMRDEARLYSFMTDKLSGRVLPGRVPVDANNHGWDASRYALEDYIAQPDSSEDPFGGVVKLW